MKIDSPSAKPVELSTAKAVYAVVFMLTVTGLFVIAFLADMNSIKNLLLVTPSQAGSPAVNVNKIEEFTESDFLITYEIQSSEKVSLAYNSFPVTVSATNSCYPQILRLELIEGSFFSRQAWTGRQRHAVLNEKAAFTIFGSNRITGSQLKIKGEIWIVTGVIKDGDEDKSRIYIPSSVTGGQVNCFIVLMSASSGFDEPFIIDSMKNLGVHRTSFDFINLDTQRDFLYERAYVSVFLLSGFIFILLMLILIKKFAFAFSVLKTKLKKSYITQILSENRIIIIKPVMIGFLLLLCPFLSLYMFLRTVSVILPWRDIISLKNRQDFFTIYIDRLYDFGTASGLLFIFFLIFLCITVIVIIRRNYEIFKF